jgi:hypothetical protein
VTVPAGAQVAPNRLQGYPSDTFFFFF